MTVRKQSRRKQSRRKQIGGGCEFTTAYDIPKAKEIFNNKLTRWMEDSIKFPITIGDKTYNNPFELHKLTDTDVLNIIQSAPNLFAINNSTKYDTILNIANIYKSRFSVKRRIFNLTLVQKESFVTGEIIRENLTCLYNYDPVPFNRSYWNAVYYCADDLIDEKSCSFDGKDEKEREIYIYYRPNAEFTELEEVSMKEVKTNHIFITSELFHEYMKYFRSYYLRNILYSGKFKKYQKTGCGFIKFKNNCSYEGSFKDDHICEQGEYIINGISYKKTDWNYTSSALINDDIDEGYYTGEISGKTSTIDTYDSGISVDLYKNKLRLLKSLQNFENKHFHETHKQNIIKINNESVDDKLLYDIINSLSGDKNSSITISFAYSRGKDKEHNVTLERIYEHAIERIDGDSGNRFGYGTTTYKKGRLVYNGYYVNNKRHGFGKLTYNSLHINKELYHEYDFDGTITLECNWIDDIPETDETDENKSKYYDIINLYNNEKDINVKFPYEVKVAPANIQSKITFDFWKYHISDNKYFDRYKGSVDTHLKMNFGKMSFLSGIYFIGKWNNNEPYSGIFYWNTKYFLYNTEKKIIKVIDNEFGGKISPEILMNNSAEPAELPENNVKYYSETAILVEDYVNKKLLTMDINVKFPYEITTAPAVYEETFDFWNKLSDNKYFDRYKGSVDRYEGSVDRYEGSVDRYEGSVDNHKMNFGEMLFLNGYKGSVDTHLKMNFGKMSFLNGIYFIGKWNNNKPYSGIFYWNTKYYLYNTEKKILQRIANELGDKISSEILTNDDSIEPPENNFKYYSETAILVEDYVNQKLLKL